MFGNNPAARNTRAAAALRFLEQAREDAQMRAHDVVDPRYTDTAAGREDEWIPSPRHRRRAGGGCLVLINEISLMTFSRQLLHRLR